MFLSFLCPLQDHVSLMRDGSTLAAIPLAYLVKIIVREAMATVTGKYST